MKIALIWASNNPEKYGNKIMKDLISKWHTVYPINPKEDNIEWVKAFRNLESLNQDFEIANFVIPPNITLETIKQYKDKLLDKKIWCQPWASNDEVKDYLEKNWFKDFITDSCIMIQKIN